MEPASLRYESGHFMEPTMRTTTAILTILLLAFSLAANANAVRFGSRVIIEGDSVGTVRQVAGPPDRIVTLENERGAAVGERWEYYRTDGTTVLVTLHGGRVTLIEVVAHAAIQAHQLAVDVVQHLDRRGVRPQQ